jgi:hypothetical protein
MQQSVRHCHNSTVLHPTPAGVHTRPFRDSTTQLSMQQSGQHCRNSKCCTPHHKALTPDRSGTPQHNCPCSSPVNTAATVSAAPPATGYHSQHVLSMAAPATRTSCTPQDSHGLPTQYSRWLSLQHKAPASYHKDDCVMAVPCHAITCTMCTHTHTHTSHMPSTCPRAQHQSLRWP